MATKKAATKAKKSTAKKQSTTTVKVLAKDNSKKTSVQSSVAKPTKSKKRVLSSVSFSAVIAEFIGTFLLAALVIVTQGNPFFVGFTLIGLVLIMSTLSNAFFNPALTVAAWITRRINGMTAIAYIIAQSLGAMLSLVVLNWFMKASDVASDPSSMLGQGGGGPVELFAASPIVAGKEWYIIAAEILGTFIFGFAVASVVKSKERISTAFTVGLGLFIALFVASTAVSTLNASVILNPAVAIALDALRTLSVWSIAIYVVG